MPDIALEIKGPIPRHAPYKQGYRGRLYVPDDVRAWRRKIARAMKPYPKPSNQSYFSVVYTFASKDHVDLDSITHSLQDAMTKDAWAMDDKEWQGSYRMSPARCKRRRDESAVIWIWYE